MTLNDGIRPPADEYISHRKNMNPCPIGNSFCLELSQQRHGNHPCPWTFRAEAVKRFAGPGVKKPRLFEDPLDRSSWALARGRKPSAGALVQGQG
ncbi:MAG: hypothetical protein V1793_10055 [Pseudomonadota bacterium]